MGQIYADSRSMQEGAADILATSKKLDSIADDITGDMKDLMGNWSGAGQQAYGQYQAQWNQIFGEVKGALMGLGNAVGLADENYVNTDNKIAQAFTPGA